MPLHFPSASRGVSMALAAVLWVWGAATASPVPAPHSFSPAPALQAAPSRPDHVVIVMEENHSYSEIIGNTSAAPYFNSLAGQGALFTKYFAQYHPSEQNYLEIFSGSDQGIGTSDPNPAPGSPFSAPNWGGELLTAGLSFVGYSEGLPSTGYSGADTGAWAYRHCPWIAFQGAAGNQIPPADNVAFSHFPTTFSALPTVSMVTPDLNDDMHDGTITQADTWLKNNLDAYAQWAKTHNSLLIVVWDEDDGTEGNQVPLIMVGDGIPAGTQNTQTLNHDSLCRFICDLYGLTPMAHAAGATAIQGVLPGGGGGPGPAGGPSSSSGGGGGGGWMRRDGTGGGAPLRNPLPPPGRPTLPTKGLCRRRVNASRA